MIYFITEQAKDKVISFLSGMLSVSQLVQQQEVDPLTVFRSKARGRRSNSVIPAVVTCCPLLGLLHKGALSRSYLGIP